MSDHRTEAVDALTQADALLRQRDDAERAMIAAAKRRRSADVPLHVAEIEAAYAGVWGALDRAAKALTDDRRCPPAFMVHRASVDDRARARGTAPAPGTPLGSTLEREGVRVAKLALAALQEAMPEIDWAARAKATPAADVKVGRGSLRTPILVVSAVVALAITGYVVVMSRPDRPRERAPVPEAEIDVSALARADTHVIVEWLRENDQRHPDATARLRATVSAELTAQLTTTTDDDVIALAIQRATYLGLGMAIVDAAHARRAAVLTAALPTMTIEELQHRLRGDGAFALAPDLRAQVLTRYDEALVAAIDAGTPLAQVSRHLETGASAPELPRASAALAARLGATFDADVAAVTTLAALRELHAVVAPVLPEDRVIAALSARATQLLAAETTVDGIAVWIESGLLDDAAIDQAATRAVGVAKRSADGARAFLELDVFSDHPATDAVVAALGRQCATLAKKARAPVIRVLAARACAADDGLLYYGTDDEPDFAEVALDALATELARVLGDDGFELEEADYGDVADLMIALAPGPACTVTIEAVEAGVTGTIKGSCPADPGTP